MCVNMKFSSTRSTPETNLVPLRCELVIRVKVTQRKTECLKFESGFCVIFYESGCKCCFFFVCSISFELQCCLHP